MSQGHLVLRILSACSKSGPKAKFDATTEKQRALNAEAREVFYLYRLACTDVGCLEMFGETFITGLKKTSYIGLRLQPVEH